MNILIIITVTYLLGFYFSYEMIKIEHVSEGETYTKIQRIINILFSLGSFLTVIILLVSSWFQKIAKTGYWNLPVIEKKNKSDNPKTSDQ